MDPRPLTSLTFSTGALGPWSEQMAATEPTMLTAPTVCVDGVYPGIDR